MNRNLLVLVAAFAFSSIGTNRVADRTCAQCDLTVHEWGTFTSIAGDDGSAIEWAPLDAVQDLPCFVDRYRFQIKGWLSGTVRMETPVLYFYSVQPTVVDASVTFKRGLVTEWYPQADVTTTAAGFNVANPAFASTITWKGVTVSPGAAANFPTEDTSSHYYAARQTDAAPVGVGGEKEKFLFYRGLGGFQPPIAAAVDAEGRVDVRNIAGGPVGDVVLFENRGGTMTYTVRHVTDQHTAIAPTALDGKSTAPTAELERILEANGLYPKEAQAMVATWRDSWFEEGTRLIYIAPRAAIDAILPLTLHPVPVSVSRVFVGRIELVTTRTKQDLKAALLNNDYAALAKYGRFVRPFAARVERDSTPNDVARIEAALRNLPFAVASSCR